MTAGDKAAAGRDVVAAAAAPVLPALRGGSARPATVVAVLRDATIIRLSTDQELRTICLLGPGATAVPNGIRLGRVPPTPPGAVGSVLTVEDSGLSAAGWRVRIVRTWDARVPAISVSAQALDTVLEAEMGLSGPTGRRRRGGSGGGPDKLTGLDPKLVGVWRTAPGQLLGLGPGLTPAGDDMLAGVMAGLHAAGHPDRAAGVLQALPDRWARTTALSADLLTMAGQGYASLELLAVIRACDAAAPAGTLAPALARLFAVGHTSGADLAIGLIAGLRTAKEGL